MSVSRETEHHPELTSHIKQALVKNGIEVTKVAIDNLSLFASLILEQNENLNLISQREPEREVVKQIADSALLVNMLSFRPGCRVLDIGSGAGFPGIVIKIINPAIELTSIDSTPGKIEFQKSVAGELGIAINTVCTDFKRFEPGQPFDISLSKAFSKKREALRKLRRWLRSGGAALFLEGIEPDSDLLSAWRKADSFHPPTILPYKLKSHNSDRHLVIFCRK